MKYTHLLLIVFVPISLYVVFTLWNNYKIIKQNIGGKLYCSAEYYADHHNWVYVVEYKYKPEGDTSKYIGYGEFQSRYWDKEVQMKRYKNWILLETGSPRARVDKLIIGDTNTNIWSYYEFIPDSLERDSIWIKAGIKSSLHTCCPQALITTIDEGIINLKYKYKVGSYDYDSSKLIYQINDTTGMPEMVSVNEYE